MNVIRNPSPKTRTRHCAPCWTLLMMKNQTCDEDKCVYIALLLDQYIDSCSTVRENDKIVHCQSNSRISLESRLQPCCFFPIPCTRSIGFGSNMTRGETIFPHLGIRARRKSNETSQEMTLTCVHYFFHLFTSFPSAN